jgi:hypothetical protein
MSTKTLDAMRLKKALASLRTIEQQIKQKQAWMKTLMSFRGNPIDARFLLEISNKLTKESMTLEITVKGLDAEARSLSRSISNKPPKQITLTKFAPSAGGELKELAAIAGRMPKQLAELRSALDQFRNFAMHKINDPERTSDGQPMDPLGLLLALLQLLVKARDL